MTGIPATEVVRRAGVPFRGMDEWPVDCVVSSEGMGESGERIPTVRPDESVAFVALRAARVGLFELTLDGELLLDDTFLAAMGYDPPVYIEDARAWGRALVHPDDLVRVGSHRDAMLAGKLPRTRFEYRLRASSGEFVWVEGVYLRTPTSVVGVHFKKPNRFGATFAQMSADTFLARLCALVPPPRAHTVLYYGVLSAHHRLRSAIVPCGDKPEPEPAPSSSPSSSRAASSSSPPSPPCCTLSSAMLPLLGCRG